MLYGPVSMAKTQIVVNPVLPVNELVERLRGIAQEAFTPEAVATTLAGVSVDDASLAPYVLWRPKCYTRNLVHRDATFELLVVCWESGSASAIHDHAGQECWLYIHRGALGIDGFELADPTQCGQVGDGVWLKKGQRRARVEQGVVDHRGPTNDIHRVMNRRAFGARAISLHVYARPIDECIVYHSADGRAERRLLQYDSVGGVEVVGGGGQCCP